MRTFIPLILFLALLPSCSKEDVEDRSYPGMEAGIVSVKASAGDFSEEIHNTAIWIYKKNPDVFRDEKAVAFAFSMDGNSVRLSLPSPEKTYYRIACNLPQSFWGKKTDPAMLLKKDINDMEFGCLSFTRESFIMSGSGSLAPASDFGELSASVRRRVAKVSVEKITNSIRTPGYELSDIAVAGFYIENGVAFIDMDWSERQPVSSSDFFNCSTIPPAMVKSPYLTSASPWSLAECVIRSPVTIRHGGFANFNPVLYAVYACRNTITTDHRWTLAQVMTERFWPLRKSRLVIHCSVGDKSMFYAITLDKVEPDTWYRFKNINLRHAGSTDPDIPVEISDADFSIEINNWEHNPQYTENI